LQFRNFPNIPKPSTVASRLVHAMALKRKRLQHPQKAAKSNWICVFEKVRNGLYPNALPCFSKRKNCFISKFRKNGIWYRGISF